MMNPLPKKVDDESQRAIDEFLANGGKIQHFDYGQKSQNVSYTNSFYGKRNKQDNQSEGSEE